MWLLASLVGMALLQSGSAIDAGRARALGLAGIVVTAAEAGALHRTDARR